jgi:hypothetical protein
MVTNNQRPRNVGLRAMRALSNTITRELSENAKCADADRLIDGPHT